MGDPVTSAIGAGSMAVGAISNAFGDKGSPQTSTSTSAPWGPQQDYIKAGFQNALDLYNQNKGTPFYQGALYAPLNDAQKAVIAQLQGFNAAGAGNVNTAMGTAGNLMGAASPFMSNAQNFASGNFGNITNPNGALSSTFNGAAQGALGSGAMFQGNASNILNRASGDPTQANIAAATQYANNPAVDGMIDAASRDVTRNLNENVLPGINQAATASGNMNSSRAGAMTAIAQRGAADRIADISSQIRGGLYSNGLNVAENARTADLNASLGANSQLGTNFSQGLTGANASIGNDIAMRGQDITGRLSGNTQLGNAATLGFNGATSAANLAGTTANLGLTAGGLQQQDAQNQLNEAFQKWQGQDQRPYDLLSRYWSIVGNPNYGKETTSTSTAAQPSALQTGLGALNGIAGLGAKSNWFGFGGGSTPTASDWIPGLGMTNAAAFANGYMPM